MHSGVEDPSNELDGCTTLDAKHGQLANGESLAMEHFSEVGKDLSFHISRLAQDGQDTQAQRQSADNYFLQHQ